MIFMALGVSFRLSVISIALHTKPHEQVLERSLRCRKFKSMTYATFKRWYSAVSILDKRSILLLLNKYDPYSMLRESSFTQIGSLAAMSSSGLNSTQAFNGELIACL